MDNRIGLKDLVPIALLVVMIILVWLGLTSAKRQAKQIEAVADQVRQMGEDIERLRAQLEKLDTETDTPSEGQ